MWIAITITAVIVIAVAVSVPLVLARDDGGAVSSSTTTHTSVLSSTTTAPLTTTSVVDSSSSTTSATTAGAPGDSSGEWVEVNIPRPPAQIMGIALSDQMLLMQALAGSAYSLYGYDFESSRLVEVAAGGREIGGIDVDGSMAVWWEGAYDDNSASYVDQHIYWYDLATGVKKEIIGTGTSTSYPQIAGMWVTWVEGSPWEKNPEEFWSVPIYGSLFSRGAGPTGEPIPLAPSATAAILGDSVWTYSLSADYLAWEQATAVGDLDPGTYILDLTAVPGQPKYLGGDTWRPSLYGDRLVFWHDGLHYSDLASGDQRDIDPRGDFPAAGPSFAAYFRSLEHGDGGYEIVARGFTGRYEQILAPRAGLPWLTPPIAVSQSRVAFIVEGVLHVFEWKGR